MNKPEAAPVVAEPEMVLDEFCAILSTERVGSEIIGGFHLDARHAGIIKSSEAAFRARFAAYSTREIN